MDLEAQLKELSLPEEAFLEEKNRKVKRVVLFRYQSKDNSMEVRNYLVL